MGSSRIEDYAIIGDCETAALVSRDGSIDWLCLPRFDSASCFAALLGDEDNGRWRIWPVDPVLDVRRRYLGGSLVLETEVRTASGTFAILDFMPPRSDAPDLVRLVVGRSGSVRLRTELSMRFDYGHLVPWVRTEGDALLAIGGPDALILRTPVPLRGEGSQTVGELVVHSGDRVPFVLAWHPSHTEPPAPLDAERALDETLGWWNEWCAHCTYRGEWPEAVVRSLVTLKALTYRPTGGVVAAPSTSLPAQIGGTRNWDYRYCWLRDATFTLYALMEAGYMAEAEEWRDWLIRAVAGRPSQIQALYGIGGERRLPETELPWLAGFEGSRPVRIGNGAHQQLQLDVFGEVMDTLHVARTHGVPAQEAAWRVQHALVEHLEGIWRQPDEGIWEIRGRRRQFTHSKVMAWVAFDRAVKGIERFGLDGPADRWRALRDEIHAEVCERGFNPRVGSFVQAYGSEELDASLLMLPLVGFLRPTDPRIRGTVEAIERHLTQDGLVMRYRSESGIDGLPPGEGAFVLCTFWLADNLNLLGRIDEARRLFERLLEIRNDVGLLPEELDPSTGQFVGNFPQAFSHVALVNTAKNLSTNVPSEESPGEERARE